jgi:hypothetical protein
MTPGHRCISPLPVVCFKLAVPIARTEFKVIALDDGVTKRFLSARISRGLLSTLLLQKQAHPSTAKFEKATDPEAVAFLVFEAHNRA